MMLEFETTVKGGFPVTAQARFYGDQIGDVRLLVARKGNHPHTRAAWLERTLSPKQWAQVEREAIAIFDEGE